LDAHGGYEPLRRIFAGPFRIVRQRLVGAPVFANG